MKRVTKAIKSAAPDPEIEIKKEKDDDIPDLAGIDFESRAPGEPPLGKPAQRDTPNRPPREENPSCACGDGCRCKPARLIEMPNQGMICVPPKNFLIFAGCAILFGLYLGAQGYGDYLYPGNWFKKTNVGPMEMPADGWTGGAGGIIE